MGLYEKHLLPRILDLACGVGTISEQRSRLVPLARGRVLEVGMGSGLNLPHYDATQVEKVWGLEPAEPIRRRASRRVQAAAMEVEWLEFPGEEIPLEDDSADTVVLTYTLCTIGDCERALAQMRRVLKPDGRLLFSEHGLAKDAGVRAWQERLNPLWRRVAGGCHLNREIPDLIERAGFRIESLDSEYLPRLPKIVAYQHLGHASVAD